MISQAILFDLDGTLIDTAQCFQSIINAVRQDRQLPAVDITAVRSAAAEGAVALTELAWNVTNQNPHFAEYKRLFLQEYQRYTLENPAIFFPGVEKLLAFVHDTLPWGIVTNKQAHFTRAIIARHPILATAKTIVSGDTTAHSKPHPAPLLYACNELLLSPTQCVFIGDHVKDILAGQRAGTTTGVALYGYISPNDHPETWQANHYFASPTAIHAWVEKNYYI